MTATTLDTAHEIVNLIPLVMRVVSAEVRRNPNFQEVSHIGLMRMLAHRGMCRMGDLAEKMSVSLPTMSKTIWRMKQRDWVRLHRDEHDRRTVWAELTPDGRAAMDEVYDQTARHIEAMVRSLPADDQETLAAGLTVLRQLFETAVQTEPIHAGGVQPREY